MDDANEPETTAMPVLNLTRAKALRDLAAARAALEASEARVLSHKMDMRLVIVLCFFAGIIAGALMVAV